MMGYPGPPTIIYRIRKNVTYREQTENRQRTEKPITEATLSL